MTFGKLNVSINVFLSSAYSYDRFTLSESLLWQYYSSRAKAVYQ